MAAATLSDEAVLAILETTPEVCGPFRVDGHHFSELGGNKQAAAIETSRIPEVCGVSVSFWIAPS